jgi:hypothetical protein
VLSPINLFHLAVILTAGLMRWQLFSCLKKSGWLCKPDINHILHFLSSAFTDCAVFIIA